MTISPLSPEDAAQLDVFKKREWALADQEHFGTAEVSFEKQSFTLVARVEDAIAGYVYCTIDMGVMYVDSVIVGAAFQKQGIARALMSAAEDQGRALGAHKAWLETGAQWQARHLYDRMGYRVVAELSNHYAGAGYILYEKLLSE